MSTNLERYLRARGVIEAETAVKIAHGIALDLGDLHRRGLVYGSLVPRHVWLDDDGDGGIAAKLLVLRNEEYQVPELRPPADIYALGIVLYEMLTGWPSFDGYTPPSQAQRMVRSTPSSTNREIPPVLDTLILRCLEKSPDKRFQDGIEVAKALESL